MEGGDQYRGWFHSSLLVGVGLKGASPYRECATHGWTLDEQGHAMHKSKGNSIEPEEIIKQYGADLLRLWTASVDFTEDVRLSKTILDRLVEAYRKLRNTFRYALGNLHDFDPAKDSVPVGEMLEIDRWILARAEDLVRKCDEWYRRVRVSQSVSRDLRFRGGRSQLDLFRCAEGSFVHVGDAQPGAPQRADGAV